MTTVLKDYFQALTSGQQRSPLAERPDRVLLQRLLSSHDEEAFLAIVDRHGGMVYRVCLRILNRSQDAEDAFQATFLVLMQNLVSIRKKASLGSWLYGVARHTALQSLEQSISRKRRERRAARSDSVAAEVNVPPLDIQIEVDREVARLPESLRQPMILCCLEGQTLQEAACQLGWSVSTLRRRLEKARSLVSQRLSQRGIVAAAALSACLFTERSALAGPPAHLAAATVQSVLLRSQVPLVLAGIASQPFSALIAGTGPSPFLAKCNMAFAMGGIFALILGFAGMIMTEHFANAQPANHSPTPLPEPSGPANSALPPAVKSDRQVAFGAFKAVAVSPNGKVVAAGGANGQTVIWNASTGRVIQEFKAAKPVMALAFVADEKTLALGTDQGGVEIWTSQPDGYARRTVVAEIDQIVYSLAASPDGKTLAVGCHSGWTQFYETNGWKPIGVVFERSNLTSGLAFAKDGSILATAGTSFRAWKLDQSAPLWRARKSQPLAQVELSSMQSLLWRTLSDGDAFDDASCADIAISPTVDLVAGVNGTSRQDSGGKTLYAWDARTGKLRWKSKATSMTNVTFVAQGQRIATGSTDGKIRLWDALTGKLLQEIREHAKAVRNLAAMPDGSGFVSAAEDGAVLLLDARTGKVLQTYSNRD